MVHIQSIQETNKGNGDTNRVSPPQTLGTSLGHSNMSDESLVNKSLQSPHSIFNRDIGINPGRLEQIELLGSPEDPIYVINTSLQVLRTYGEGKTSGISAM